MTQYAKIEPAHAEITARRTAGWARAAAPEAKDPRQRDGPPTCDVHKLSGEEMLDRPVWWALATRLGGLAERVGSARAMPCELGPFADIAGDTPQQLSDFSALVSARAAPVVTLRARNMRAPGGLDRALAAGVQMIADSAPPRVTPYEIATLDEGDRNQIYRLAQQAKPGPFARQTHRLGTFLGIKQGGTLVAMAGQRLKLPGFTEISAVCVAPGHRGQGLAAALVSEMMHRIIAAGDQPFLHAYADNTAAIALYRRLSFRVRTRVQVSCWTHASLAETG